MRRKIQNIRLKLLLSLSLMLGVVQLQGQVSANCVNNFNLSLDYFGVDTLWPQDINAGSTNADSFLLNGQPFLVYDCTQIGMQSLSLIAINSSTGASDTCTTSIMVTDQIAPQAVCLSNLSIMLDSFGNATLAATMLDPNNASFDACGIASYSIGGQASINLSCSDLGTSTITTTLTDFSGNISTCATNLTVNDPGICAAGPLTPTIDTIIGTRCDTNSCTGQVQLSVQGGWPPYQLTWSDATIGTTLLRTGLCAGSYSVTVVDAVGTQVQLGPFDVETLPGCVWPGDTDNNRKAAHFDLLPIALAYGETGLLRPNASINWQGEAAPDWQVNTNIIDLPDWKHIDANGDAVIDTLDLDAIHQNYNQEYYPVQTTILSPLGLVPFYIDTVQAIEGQPVSTPLNLGSMTTPADSIYALAFSIVYDSSLVDPGSLSIEFKNSWLGGDLLTLYKDFPFNGRVEVALGRKDRQAITGFGEIAAVNFTIRDDVFRAPTTRTMPIRIEQVRLVDEWNNLLPVTAIAGELRIDQISNTYNAESESVHHDLQLFPNPADQVLNVRLTSSQMEHVCVFNMAGQLIFEEANPTMLLTQIDVSTWPEGIYAVEVKTKETVLQQTVMIR